MTSIEERVLQNIDLQDLLATLNDLIAIQSLSGQETPAQEYIADWMPDPFSQTFCWFKSKRITSSQKSPSSSGHYPLITGY
jgi:hypothetical protein